jgi:hypothetical protein
MPRARLAVELRPRSEACRATAGVSEGVNFGCRFRNPNRKNRPENLGDTIARQLGTEWSAYRVVVAEVEFMFSRYHGESDYHLDEISHYTNPEMWERSKIVAPAATARDAFFEFAIAEEELDVISLQAEMEIACDPTHRLIVFNFAPGVPEATWFRIADSVLVSQTQAGDLKSILFEDVEF